MIHEIPINVPQGGQTPIPHCFQYPPYTKDGVYELIVPKDYQMKIGDSFSGWDGSLKAIVEQRPARGDWSKQPIHKHPDYIKILVQ